MLLLLLLTSHVTYSLQQNYYIVVPLGDTNGTSAQFKQKQEKNSKAGWDCENGKNPIVYSLDSQYEIQGRSIDLVWGSDISCIGLNVVVVKRREVYVWGDEGSRPRKCPGYLTKTDKLEYNESISGERLTKEFALSPPVQFDVYTTRPTEQCAQETIVKISPQKVLYDLFNDVSLKPSSCSLTSSHFSLISCNMTLLAQIGEKTAYETFSTATSRKNIAVPSFIWEFKPLSIMCKAICEIYQQSDVRVASAVYKVEYSDPEQFQYQEVSNCKMYMIATYILGPLFLVTSGVMFFFVSLTRRQRKRSCKCKSTVYADLDSRTHRNTECRSCKTGTVYADFDAGLDTSGYSRIYKLRPCGQCSLPPLPRDTATRDNTHYNTVSVKLSDCLSAASYSRGRQTNPWEPILELEADTRSQKTYEKLTF